MDLRIINFPKPVVALLDGIVMGGGVGISIGASHKIVTEKTKWAMPEVNIGFFPDVGGTFFMNQIPEEMARYISFLAKFLTGDDVVFLGFADTKFCLLIWGQKRGNADIEVKILMEIDNI
jgi:enoyl-CoA hydratase/carnithine racemase